MGAIPVAKMQSVGKFNVPGIGIVMGLDVKETLRTLRLPEAAAKRVNREIKAHLDNGDPLSPEVQSYLANRIAGRVENKRERVSSFRG